MKRPKHSDCRRLASVALLWSTLSCGLRAEEEPIHEPPRLLPAVPSVYLRVPYGTGAQAGTLSPEAPSAALTQVAPNSVFDSTVPTRLPAVQGAVARVSELWLVSTRRLPRAGDSVVAPTFAPDVSRYVWGQGWMPSSLEEFLGTSTNEAITTVFVHGNDTTAEDALRGGCGLFSQLLGNAAAPAPLARFVIWSWPNESTTLRVRKSAQANAGRVNMEGFLLAEFLERVAQRSPTSVVGYSSGAGVATGALHALGGGALDGRVLATLPCDERNSINAVLLGAAMPNDWLLPGRPHERAVSQAERLVMTVNPTDAVLRWYPFLWGRNGPAALGATGIAQLAPLGPDQAKIAQPNLEAALQTRHGWRYYSGSPEVIALLRREMLEHPAVRVGRNVASRRSAGAPQVPR